MVNRLDQSLEGLMNRETSARAIDGGTEEIRDWLRSRIPSGHGPALNHWTMKLVPSLEMDDGCAFTVLVLDELTIVICWTDVPKEPSAPVTPFKVTAQLTAAVTPVLSIPNPAVPKFASDARRHFSRPQTKGASTMNSAELLAAPETAFEVANWLPVV